MINISSLTRNNIILASSLFSLLSVVARAQQPVVLKTDYMAMELDGSGRIIHLSEQPKITGAQSPAKDYVPARHASPLLSLYKDSTFIEPVSSIYKGRENKLIIKYANGSVATIAAENKGAYLRFTLQSVSPRNGIQAAVWGPYGTTIQQSIGETICVVHDADFAIGMQSLDINTIEGLPTGNDNADGGSFIDPLPGQALPDSLKPFIGKRVPINVNEQGDMPAYVRMYRGDAAVKTPYGSELRLFARDRRIPRVVHNGPASGPGLNVQYVEPINVDLAGSSIAFFGCPEPKVLDVIGDIEVKEHLPHPMLDGQWVKKSPVPGQAYLMFEGKNEQKGIEYAKDCGFHLIHLGDVFQSWGHFGLQTRRYPGGAPDIRKNTDVARADGIRLGMHTLTMFTGANDAYVTPVPSDSLCKAGTTVLSQSITTTDKEISIDDPEYFRNLVGTHTVQVGKELINYRAVSEDKPWRLLDCRRAQYGTQASEHAAGTTIASLVNNSYRGFYPDIHLQDAYSKRLAAVCDSTGLGLIDFDGFGGESPTGQGTYGAARFVEQFYKNLHKYVLVCGAGTFHYYWHVYSFMNWGEPWYNELRHSQVNYRIENQRYFERNYMPHMLGWFAAGVDYRPEEIEWIQARSAAYNAGYLLRVGDNIEQNGFKDTLFSLVSEWQKARSEHAFTQEQLTRFQDPKNEFHLEKVSEGRWNLYPVSLSLGYEHRYRPVQTGEPIANKYTFINPYAEQPIRMYATIVANGGAAGETISNLVITFNNYQALEIPGPLKAGDRIYVDGKHVFLCDAGWKKINEIKGAVVPSWNKGENDIEVKSDFSSEHAPTLKMDFESKGTPETVQATNAAR